MTISHFFYQLLIMPLELVFEVVFGFAMKIGQNCGAAIFALSMVMNLLLLPLYRRADAIQEQQREIEKRMEPGVRHIKQTFRGDERFMMLQAYYRKNNYKPFSALKGSLPLMLEIPFFIAAYHFLSHLELLNGTAFGPIRNLAAPDGLLTVGGVTISVLPILMTLINFVSSAIYTKGLPARDKLQLYGMAVIFLVLLYNSPSGLVFYWTLNNLFSLGKNLLGKLKKPGTSKKTLPLPTLAPGREKVFFGSAALLTVLTGLLIPSAVIASSPAEFIHVVAYRSPLFHVLNAFLFAAGLFLLWFTLFYLLSDQNGKSWFSLLLWLTAGLGIINYMFFGTGLGTISPELRFDKVPAFSAREILGNFAVMLAAAAVLFLLWEKRAKLAQNISWVLTAAVIGMSILNIGSISRELPEIKMNIDAAVEEQTRIPLSRNGKNVVVLMSDRAISAYIPYLFQEKPELKEQFAGFTYYPNTLSYGAHTKMGAPALYGGYEYTPEELNKRDSEKMVDKHNEALKVMPVLFSNAGFEVTVCDPSYANYKEIPDLSIYGDYPEIHTYLTESGQFLYKAESLLSETNKIWERDFFCYSLMKISPLFLQPRIYRQGTYCAVDTGREVGNPMSYHHGTIPEFVYAYSALHALPDISEIQEDGNTFLMMANSATHAPSLLVEPEYEPANVVDNREYDAAHWDRFSLNGKTLHVDDQIQMGHYQSNMAVMLQLGRWFDYLRKNGVYDNTRIIIVADHGYAANQLDEMIFGSGKYDDAMNYNPLLLFKDFNASEFTTDERLMTNADTPILATGSLIENPRNPFTGKPIDDSGKSEPEQHVYGSHEWSAVSAESLTLPEAIWYSGAGDIRNAENWHVMENP